MLGNETRRRFLAPWRPRRAQGPIRDLLSPHPFVGLMLLDVEITGKMEGVTMNRVDARNHPF